MSKAISFALWDETSPFSDSPKYTQKYTCPSCISAKPVYHASTTTFQICQMDASGDLIALETQTQNNSDDTVTLTAQTQSMGTFVIQGTKQDTSSEASFATVLPYVLLLIIVLLIIFAGRRTKGSKG